MTATAIAQTRTGPVSRLLPLVLPAIVVGIGSSIALATVTAVAGVVERVIWDDGPGGDQSATASRSNSRAVKSRFGRTGNGSDGSIGRPTPRSSAPERLMVTSPPSGQTVIR